MLILSKDGRRLIDTTGGIGIYVDSESLIASSLHSSVDNVTYIAKYDSQAEAVKKLKSLGQRADVIRL